MVILFLNKLYLNWIFMKYKRLHRVSPEVERGCIISLNHFFTQFINTNRKIQKTKTIHLNSFK